MKTESIEVKSIKYNFGELHPFEVFAAIMLTTEGEAEVLAQKIVDLKNNGFDIGEFIELHRNPRGVYSDTLVTYNEFLYFAGDTKHLGRRIELTQKGISFLKEVIGFAYERKPEAVAKMVQILKLDESKLRDRV